MVTGDQVVPREIARRVVCSGGGSGGGGDEEPGGGCTSCNCYYQTTYAWANLEDGCGDKYQRIDYICDGVVVSQGSWEYLGWICDYYY